MIDLFRYFIGSSRVVEINRTSIRPYDSTFSAADNVVASLSYEDGSVCNLFYTALGNPGLPKEHIEVFFDGKAPVIDDFRRIQFHGLSAKSIKFPRQDKGHLAELIAFAESIKNQNEPPIDTDDLIETTRISFQLAND